MRYECECGKVWRDRARYDAHKCTPPKVASERVCLRCGNAFQSWGAGNRLCKLCMADADGSRSRLRGFG
jgi:hypothetical protein